MQFIVSDNLPDVLRYVRGMERAVAPVALAKALTFTAEGVREAEYAEMLRVFDRPSKFTLNALRMKPASASSLSAGVFFREFGGTPASNYLTPHIRGGGRGQKRSERALSRAGLMGNNGFWVPGAGASLDQSGNVRGSRMAQMLSYVRASSDAGQNRGKGLKKAQWFVPPPGSRLKPGIYRREGRGIKPELIFVPDVKYQKRFAFYDLARRVSLHLFPQKWAKSLERELRQLKLPS